MVFIEQEKSYMKSLEDFHLKVFDVTIPDQEIWFVASGREFACRKLICNGKLVVEGKVIV